MLRSLHAVSSDYKALDGLLDMPVLDRRRLHERVLESLHIKCHLQLFMWLQGEFQRCVPHQIFIAAWGDFSTGVVQYDLVSAIPSVRTCPNVSVGIRQFISHLFNRWIDHGGQPFGYSFEGIGSGQGAAASADLDAFQGMRSVLAHGIRDARGQHDCIYVFLNTETVINPWTLDTLRITVPFVDAALRQVTHLPCQYPATSETLEPLADSQADENLSSREQEIMNWVKMGKTNYEIGMILNISTFTVKNHLQRIFRKLDVTNRAQASAQVRDVMVEAPVAPDQCAVCPRLLNCGKTAGAAA